MFKRCVENNVKKKNYPYDKVVILNASTQLSFIINIFSVSNLLISGKKLLKKLKLKKAKMWFVRPECNTYVD
jgi:hypothetical protein